MKVLVTGGTGYVGGNAVIRLLADGHDVRILARRPIRVATTLGAVGVDIEQLDVVQGDMTDRASVTRAVNGVDATIHAAAVVAALDRTEAAHALDANVNGTRNVIGAALDAGCDPVVHVSSIAAVFSPAVPVLTSDLPPVSDASNPYTRSKALAEEYARELQAQGAPVTIVYPGGVMGPPVGELCGDAAEGFGSVLRSGVYPLTSGGVNVIDARDLGAILSATLQPGRGPRRYMAGGTLVSLPEMLAAFRQVTGRRLVGIRTPGSLYRVGGTALDALRRVVPFHTIFTAEAMQLLTRAKETDDSAVRDELGISYRPAMETITEALRSLYAAGHISARQAGVLAG
jgi:nucleoside-diphosphate-sugar epimerase